MRAGAKGMLAAMIVLAVGVLLLVGLQGGWSFSPGQASVDEQQAPRQDARKQLTTVAEDVHFPVRVPELPGNWRSNSGDVNPVGSQSAVRTGWVTPDHGFLRLMQSDAPVGALVADAAEAKDGAPSPEGSRRVDGQTWTVYPGVRNERSWLWDTGKARLVITGNATEQQFKVLAKALTEARPLN